MIVRTDRVSTVIGRDESLIDVFVSLSPAFERLRSPRMRKVMARLVTVEQAARMAGVNADELVSRLNGHAAAETATAPTTEVDDVMGMHNESKPAAPALSNDAGSKPAVLAAIEAERIVLLDVRDELRAGREPFSLIMGALRGVPDGGALVIRAIFEPVPLYAVMKRQGLEHWTEQLAADDWRVSFYPPGADADVKGATPTSAAPAPAPAPVAGDPEGDVIVLDVRGMEPPEPMVRTLAALEALPAGATLVQLNVRVPQFLLPMLEERGFTCHVREQEPDLVRVFIRHNNPSERQAS